VEIRELDASDEALTRRFWELGKAADQAGRPWSAFWSWEAARAAFATPSSSGAKLLLGAFEGETMLGGAEITLPKRDNTHLALLEAYVDPVHQRRGAGTALVDAATETVARHGRSIVLVEVATPMGGPESPALRLARRAGFRTGVVNDVKVVDLDATEHLWQPILAETKAAAEGYTLRSWRQVCPDDLVDGYCALLASFVEETPTGDLDVEPELWDEQRLREKEERFRRAGRHETTTVVVAPDGDVVGLTEAMVSAHAPDRGFQGGTIVSAAHRGHRLGLRMKVTNQVLVREEFPDCRTLLTSNADVNDAMNAVNDRLGFRPVERAVEMQKQLGDA
jgi:GNAT superfamily N-acetyltransferase